MNDQEPPLSFWRVVEFIVVAVILLAIAGSWLYGVLDRVVGQIPLTR